MASDREELPPLKILLNQLDWNLQWLRQMEQNPPTDYYRDAALQRFEFTFNAAVKCIRAGARKHQAECASPEESFALAERLQWFTEGTPWKDILRDMKYMKPGSGHDDPDAIFAHLKIYREHFQTLFDRLTTLDRNS